MEKHGSGRYSLPGLKWTGEKEVILRNKNGKEKRRVVLVAWSPRKLLRGVAPGSGYWYEWGVDSNGKLYETGRKNGGQWQTFRAQSPKGRPYKKGNWRELGPASIPPPLLEFD